MNTLTTEDLYLKINRVLCQACRETHMVGPSQIIDWEMKSESDVEDAADVMECCDAPFPVGIIHSEKPLFDSEDIDDQVHVAAGPATRFAPARARDVWDYEVSEDFIVILAEAGIVK